MQWALAALVLVLLLAGGLAWRQQHPPERRFTQEDIDAAVLHTLQNKVLPSPAARAVAKIAPSVVRVVGYSKEPPKGPKHKSTDKDAAKEADKEVESGVGTGVVIVDS